MLHLPCCELGICSRSGETHIALCHQHRASVPCRGLSLLLFSMAGVPGCWLKVSLCPAHAHREAGTREIADFPSYSKISQHLEMEAQPFGAKLPAGEFRSSCHLPSHCKGAWFGICQLSTRQQAEDRNGFVIPSCKWSLCCARAGAAQIAAEYLPFLLLQGEAGRPRAHLWALLPFTLPGTLDHACAFSGVSYLSQDHWLFFILILLTLVWEIALALNSFLHQWVPWNAHSRILRMPEDASPSWGKERVGWKEQVCKQELFLAPAAPPCSMECRAQLRAGSGLCGHEPGAAVMPLVCGTVAGAASVWGGCSGSSSLAAKSRKGLFQPSWAACCRQELQEGFAGCSVGHSLQDIVCLGLVRTIRLV